MPADVVPVELWFTLAALLTGVALAGAMAVIERRPRRDLNPRLIPTTPLLFIGVTVGFLALVHLLNLWGLHTGSP
jgi:hypothetical protein